MKKVSSKSRVSKATVSLSSSIRKYSSQRQLDSSLRHESRYGTCPICSKSVPRALLENHASTCVFAPTTERKVNESVEAVEVKDHACLDNPSDETGISIQPLGNRSGGPVKNAFAMLKPKPLAAFAKQNEKVVMYEHFHVSIQSRGNPPTGGVGLLYTMAWNQCCDTVRNPRADTGLTWVSFDPVVLREGKTEKRVWLSLDMSPEVEELFSSVDWEDPALPCNNPPRDGLRLSPSMLKSCLQKSVRRGNGVSAGRAALQLARLNPLGEGGARGLTELLRRLSVICLEDAILHPDFGLLTFLTLADTKGMRPCRLAVDVCLTIAQQLGEANVKDLIVTEGRAASDASNLGVLPEHSRALVLSIMARSCLGGMRGDIAMMKAASMHWQKRLGTSSGQVSCCRPPSATASWEKYLRQTYPCLPGGLMDHRSWQVLSMGGFPLAAIDFHCSNIVDDMLQDPSLVNAVKEAMRLSGGLQVDMKALVERSIWVHSASVNTKNVFRCPQMEGSSGYGEVTDLEKCALSRVYAAIENKMQSTVLGLLKRRRVG